jgi:hypothetical protein
MNFSRVSSLRVDSIRSIPATVSLRPLRACGHNLPVKAVNRVILHIRFIRDNSHLESGRNLRVRVDSNLREYGHNRREVYLRM